MGRQSAVIPGRHHSNDGQLNGEHSTFMSDCNISKKLQIKCTLDGVQNLVFGTSMSENLTAL